MIKFDLNIALDIHKDEIRKKRKEVFPDLDVQFMKALESGNMELAAEIGAKKNQLRNLTNIDTGSIQSIDDLKSMWPEELLGSSPYSGSL